MTTPCSTYVRFNSDDLDILVRRLGPSHPITLRVRDALDDLTNAQSSHYRDAAHELAREGELEIDPNAIVSKGDDAGAYVMAWLWVGDEDLAQHEDT